MLLKSTDPDPVLLLCECFCRVFSVWHKMNKELSLRPKAHSYQNPSLPRLSRPAALQFGVSLHQKHQVLDFLSCLSICNQLSSRKTIRRAGLVFCVVLLPSAASSSHDHHVVFIDSNEDREFSSQSSLHTKQETYQVCSNIISMSPPIMTARKKALQGNCHGSSRCL